MSQIKFFLVFFQFWIAFGLDNIKLGNTVPIIFLAFDFFSSCLLSSFCASSAFNYATTVWSNLEVSLPNFKAYLA